METNNPTQKATDRKQLDELISKIKNREYIE